MEFHLDTMTYTLSLAHVIVLGILALAFSAATYYHGKMRERERWHEMIDQGYLPRPIGFVRDWSKAPTVTCTPAKRRPSELPQSPQT